MPTKKNLTAELPNDKALIEGYALGVAVDKTGDTMTGNLEAPSMTIGGEVVYNEANILGAVSQVGGVPTGAIIETGTNANGTYIKYADGTLICSFSDTVLRTTSSVFGSIYSSAYFSLTFPVSFIATPIVTSGATIGSGRVWPSLAPNNNSSMACYLLGSANTDTGYVTYTAIGRWF